ncbi:MAG: hypothetical protein ACREXS_17620 [Gammaproteobacteria bacterium]
MAAGIDEAADDLVAAIELGDGTKLVLVEEALDQSAVDLLADAPVLSVDEVDDLAAIGKRDAAEIAEHIVVVGRGERALGLGGQLAVGGVAIGVAAAGENSYFKT